MRRMLFFCVVALFLSWTLSAREGRRLYSGKCGWIKVYETSRGYELLIKNSSLGQDVRWNLGRSCEKASETLSQFVVQSTKLEPGRFFTCSIGGNPVKCELRKFFSHYSFIISSDWFEGVLELPMADVNRICGRLQRNQNAVSK